MKSLVFTVLFFICTNLVWAQDLENTEIADDVKTADTVAVSDLSTYLQNAQYLKAIEYIDQQEPTKELLYQKAICYKSLSDYSKAGEILESLSEAYPEDIPIRLQLALCYEATLLFGKSIVCYDKLVELDSTNTYFRVRKADLLYRSEKYQEALSVYFKIDTAYNPNYIIRSIAMCHDKLNQTEHARACYAEAWDLNPKDAYSALSLVKLLANRQEYRYALRCSEAFILQDSTNLQMNVLNAFIYYNTDQYDEALQRFEKCLAQGDSTLLVNRSVGNIYYIQGKDSLALPYLNQAYLQDTTNMIVLYSLANINCKLKLYPEALVCYTKLLDRLTSNGNLHFLVLKGMGMSLEGNGTYQDAMSFYKQAIQKTQFIDDQMDVYYRLANICENGMKDYNQTLFYYGKYRLSLFNYQNSLKDEADIEEIEQKLIALDEHIRKLKEAHDVDKNNPTGVIIVNAPK
jgi:tetratricopeptide (TPR) repeat protein